MDCSYVPACCLIWRILCACYRIKNLESTLWIGFGDMGSNIMEVGGNCVNLDTMPVTNYSIALMEGNTLHQNIISGKLNATKHSSAQLYDPAVENSYQKESKDHRAEGTPLQESSNTVHSKDYHRKLPKRTVNRKRKLTDEHDLRQRLTTRRQHTDGHVTSQNQSSDDDIYHGSRNNTDSRSGHRVKSHLEDLPLERPPSSEVRDRSTRKMRKRVDRTLEPRHRSSRSREERHAGRRRRSLHSCDQKIHPISHKSTNSTRYRRIYTAPSPFPVGQKAPIRQRKPSLSPVRQRTPVGQKAPVRQRKPSLSPVRWRTHVRQKTPVRQRTPVGWRTSSQSPVGWSRLSDSSLVVTESIHSDSMSHKYDDTSSVATDLTLGSLDDVYPTVDLDLESEEPLLHSQENKTSLEDNEICSLSDSGECYNADHADVSEVSPTLYYSPGLMSNKTSTDSMCNEASSTGSLSNEVSPISHHSTNNTISSTTSEALSSSITPKLSSKPLHFDNHSSNSGTTGPASDSFHLDTPHPSIPQTLQSPSTSLHLSCDDGNGTPALPHTPSCDDGNGTPALPHTPSCDDGNGTPALPHTPSCDDGNGTPALPHTPSCDDGNGTPVLPHTPSCDDGNGTPVLPHTPSCDDGNGTPVLPHTPSCDDGNGTPVLPHAPSCDDGNGTPVLPHCDDSSGTPVLPHTPSCDDCNSNNVPLPLPTHLNHDHDNSATTTDLNGCIQSRSTSSPDTYHDLNGCIQSKSTSSPGTCTEQNLDIYSSHYNSKTHESIPDHESESGEELEEGELTGSNEEDNEDQSDTIHSDQHTSCMLTNSSLGNVAFLGIKNKRKSSDLSRVYTERHWSKERRGVMKHSRDSDLKQLEHAKKSRLEVEVSHKRSCLLHDRCRERRVNRTSSHTFHHSRSPRHNNKHLGRSRPYSKTSDSRLKCLPHSRRLRPHRP